jgi:hypothetical protein
MGLHHPLEAEFCLKTFVLPKFQRGMSSTHDDGHFEPLLHFWSGTPCIRIHELPRKTCNAVNYETTMLRTVNEYCTMAKKMHTNSMTHDHVGTT